MLRWILFVIFYLALGAYTLQALKTATRYPWVYYLFMAISLLVLGNFIYQFTWGETQGRVLSRPKSYAFGLLLTVLAFQAITILFLFSEDIFRLIAGGYQRFFGSSKTFSLPERRRFLSLLGLGLASIPFGALLYGMYKGKYNFQVLKYNLEFDDLPEAFDGYQITQISDVHSGSFDDRKKAFEKKFINDAEIKFKVDSRRNKYIGEWVADKLGKNEKEKKDYIDEVIKADFEEPGDSDVYRKILKDFQNSKKNIDEKEIKNQMEEALKRAKKDFI